MGYHWKKEAKGQYVDGHEREDVVQYQQEVFLPMMEKYGEQTRKWANDGSEIIPLILTLSTPHVVIWFHDKSIFYAHDRQRTHWIHQDETPMPYAKGEGALFMVSDFVSADYGWLCHGSLMARVMLKPRKNRDGYFTNEDILHQATAAMDILSTHFPNDHHIFVFDNATIHCKQSEDSPSALKMP